MAATPQRIRRTDAEVAEQFLEITGTVQGVGFRPFVARLAARLGLRGWVRNDGRGVTVRLLGSAGKIDEFRRRLKAEPPPAAQVRSIHRIAVRATRGFPPAPVTGFVILGSEEAGPRTAAIVPDLALCDACRRELGAPGDRRHAYPFINCTHCGPRYSIIERLPYDRERTTMSGFRMCPACEREFGDPADRRYHAQPNACDVCGPRMILRDASGRVLADRARAIERAATALRAGRIVAVKGLGGFHLMVDAANDGAVRELRRRKHREEKPLAVMFPSMEALRRAVKVGASEARHLQSAAAPIVLLRRRAGAAIGDSVAPGNPWIGALLPYTPLHVLLLEAVGGPVVATSGNLSEEPLCTDDDEAAERLGAIADLFLGHDRRIARPVDDSVMRVMPKGVVILRRSRGLAPAPFRLPPDARRKGALLCVGGHMKNTIAVALGTDIVMSPHLGDLGNPRAVAAFRRATELLGAMHGCPFERVACDLHPDYASTRFAESLGLPVVPVQHHLAHILACLLEHGGGPSRVLGVAWDGTGYGSDGTIWGGEFIVVDREARTARRVAHLRPFRLPGGEAAVREPRRSALALCHEASGGDRRRLEPLAESLGFRPDEAGLLLAMLDRGRFAPVTTSVGRLFDGAAALLALRLRATFEGQAAMEVEFAAAQASGRIAPWPMPLVEGLSGSRWEVDWSPVVAELGRFPSSGNRAMLAARFHASLAMAIVAVAEKVGVSTVVLTGGCFQNIRLLRLADEGLCAAGFRVLRHCDLPPNDGAIAAGQALGANWGLVQVSDAPA